MAPIPLVYIRTTRGRCLGPLGMTVASLSLGATRTFRIRAMTPWMVNVASTCLPDAKVLKGVSTTQIPGRISWSAAGGSIIADVPHRAGDLLLMVTDFQSEFTHEIPVQKKVTEYRISLTFRKDQLSQQ